MRIFPTKIASAAAALALLASAPAMAAPAMNTAPNGWAALSQLNTAGATALAGSNAVASPAMLGTATAAAQPADDGEYHANPFPWPVAIVLLGVVATAIYIALIEKHHGHVTVPTPNSPA
jgi:hypothetical protein